MAKVSYRDHIKKNDVSVILAEILFQNLKKDHTSLPLFELAETSSGGTPDRANQSYYGGKIPWFKSGELNDSTINMSEEFITEEGLSNSSAKVFPKGTLLVAMYGATAGKTAILDIDAATNQAICAVFPRDKRIRNDFLFWFLRAHRYYYIDISRGGAQPNISQTVIKNTEVPLVDENEQKSIVEFLTKIEKSKETNYSLIPKQLHKAIKLAFEHLDCLQKLENENLNQSSYLTILRQSILREAIEGKLTAKWRDKHPDLIIGDNHASKLLEKIKAEKERLNKEGNTSTKLSARIKKEKPLVPITDSEKPFDLPEGWVWCRLEDISNLIGGFAYESTIFKKDGQNQVLRLGNIRPDFIRMNENPVYIGEQQSKETGDYKLKTDDILITMTGTRDKKDYLYTVRVETNPYKGKYLFLNQRIGVIRLLVVKAHFYNLVLKHQALMDMIFSTATGSANQANIGITALKTWPIPLAPLAEQQAIVERVDKLMGMIDELEKQVSERKEQSEMLMQSVLREAFAKG